jgi:hypothetical protein
MITGIADVIDDFFVVNVSGEDEIWACVIGSGWIFRIAYQFQIEMEEHLMVKDLHDQLFFCHVISSPR